VKYSCSCFQPLALGTVWLRSRRRTAFRVLRLGGNADDARMVIAAAAESQNMIQKFILQF